MDLVLGIKRVQRFCVDLIWKIIPNLQNLTHTNFHLIGISPEAVFT